MAWPKGRPRSPETIAKLRTPQAPPLAERFWSKVNVAGPNDCWYWTASTRADGYGQIGLAELKRPEPAHRVSWQLAYGQVPDGMDVDHMCHNQDDNCTGRSSCPHRRCVNPAHLRVVPRRANLLAGRGLSAAYADRAHCKHGHLLDEANTYHRPGQPYARDCRRCRADTEARRRERVRRSTTSQQE